MKYPVRSIFKAPAGCVFLAFDLSQAESWVTAYLSREDKIKEALAHGDFHSQTASILFNKPQDRVTKEERYVGKRYNHACSYGMSPQRATEVINKDAREQKVTITLAQSKSFHEKWHNYYNNIRNWWKEVEYELRSNCTLTTPYGRKRTFYGYIGPEMFKEGYAFLPQSTVSDHTIGYVQPELGIEGGLIKIHDTLKTRSLNHTDCKIVHTAYDSGMLEIPYSAIQEVASIVYNAVYRPLLVKKEQFYIPVEIEVGERWGELEKVQV